MDEQAIGKQKAMAASEPTVYEQLYRQLHAYHFGAIGFLELLDRFEQILHIHPPPDNQDMGGTTGPCDYNKPG